MDPLVSILIPAYNAERWIAEALESALAQTWPRREIIVVDDGSSDETLAVARRYASAQVQVISQSNAGAAAARNRALRAAQGNYLQYLDADDLLAPDKIERQLEMLSGCGDEQLAAGAWARFYQHPSEARFVPQLLWADAAPVDLLVTAWSNNLMIHPAAWLVPRPLSERAGWWDESLSLDDDGEYFSRVILASAGVKFCPAAKSYYRSGLTISLSGRRSATALASAYRSIELSSRHLLDVENSSRTRHTVATRHQRFIYEVYPAARELRAAAQARVKELGGTDLPVEGGPVFQKTAGLIGWKLARRLQHLVQGRVRKGLTAAVRRAPG